MANLLLLVGTMASGIVGFGSNLIAAPVLVLLDPRLVPGPAIASSLVTNLVMMRLYRGERPWARLRGPLLGLGPGAALGALVLASISKRTLGMVIGVVVLVALGLIVRTPGRRLLRSGALAGLLSGTLQTSVSIGGPPIALWSRDLTPDDRRALLPRFFLVASAIGVLALAASGQFGWPAAVRSLELMPGSVGGLVLARLIVRRRRDHPWSGLVYGLVAVSGLGALAHGLW